MTKIDGVDMASFFKPFTKTPKANEIKTVCMYCHRHIRGPVNSTNISHGLCERCFKLTAED